ncbi:DUF4097 family beta strand repeat-containing protein [Streptococcus ictaluri]|uniref:DUF4097 domain-containing protein n=1 Tax=Streptococcus ictaluri 707-05 TaxID=764299 RepID=G5K0P8_9STRE|nr:DUF4097 family beta strand repeat-containing protein [Streptococcus ictaluri]EHI70574.1 hypothetical protein STRIC_0174 [Streptococcus ictaluri 707-05]
MTQTLNKIDDIDLAISNYEVVIETSEIKQPTVSYYTHPKFLDPIKVSATNGTLNISQKYRDFVVTGAIEIMGFTFNDLQRHANRRQIIITLPKNTVLKELKGHNFFYVSLNNITIKKFELTAPLQLIDSRIEQGDIQGPLTATRSNLKQITANSGDNLVTLTDSILENSDITIASGGFTTYNSQLSHVSIHTINPGGVECNDGSIYTIQFTTPAAKENDEYSSQPVSLVAFNKVKLTGKNKFQGGNIDMDLTLVNSEAIQYQAETVNGTIRLGDKLASTPLSKESSSGKTIFKTDNASDHLVDISVNTGNIDIH